MLNESFVYDSEVEMRAECEWRRITIYMYNDRVDQTLRHYAPHDEIFS